MKNIILLLLLIAPVYCFAQVDTLKYKQKEEFCEVQAGHMFGGKYEIIIDNGQDASGKATRLKDVKGDYIKFPSMVSIMSYMAKRGWVLITTYTEVAQGSSNGTHLLYKREL